MPTVLAPVGDGSDRGRQIFWGVLVGTLLLQLAWVAALPTFRGSDEFDHAYKADAVAAGQLRGEVDAADGRGQLLAVRPDVVRAAGGWCSFYEYTGPDNCRAVAPAAGGRVQVASAAASYNPAWYAVAGTLARVADGHAFLLGLRLVSAVVVAALLALAVATTASRARTSWPLLALGVSVTPTLVLAGGVAAPNGVGYAAGVLWWVSALSVALDRRPAWGRLTLASVLLVGTHTLNVLWLPLMTLAVLALCPLRSWPARLRSRRARAAIVVVGVAELACVAWIRLADTNRLAAPAAEVIPTSVARMLVQQVIWVVQTMATGPLRDEQAPILVLVLWAMVLVVVLVLGVRAADRLVLRAGAVVLSAWLVVPVVLTLVSYTREGYAWQGRYALPLVVGLTLLAGTALDRRTSPRASLLHVAAGMLVLAQVAAVVPWVVHEAGDRLGWQLADLVPTPVAVTLVTAASVAGGVLVAWAARQAAPAGSAPRAALPGAPVAAQAQGGRR